MHQFHCIPGRAYLILRHVQNTKNCPNLVPNLQQPRRIYARKTHLRAIESQSRQTDRLLLSHWQKCSPLPSLKIHADRRPSKLVLYRIRVLRVLDSEPLTVPYLTLEIKIRSGSIKWLTTGPEINASAQLRKSRGPRVKRCEGANV